MSKKQKEDNAQLLTRHIGKSRKDTANRLSNLLTREYKIAIGEIEATPSQVNALRNQIGRIMPGVNPEDLREIISPPQSTEEQMASLSNILDSSTLSLFVRHRRKDAEKVRDTLNQLLASNVVEIKKSA